MSALYYFEIIKATKDEKNYIWFYEGRDIFSRDDIGLIKGDELIKEIWNLLDAGWKVKATTKDGKNYDFTSTKDLLIFCFSSFK